MESGGGCREEGLMGELTVELERMVSRCFFGRCMTIESLAP